MLFFEFNHGANAASYDNGIHGWYPHGILNVS